MSIISIITRSIVLVSYYINIIDDHFYRYLFRYILISPLTLVILVYTTIVLLLVMKYLPTVSYIIEVKKVIDDEVNYIPTKTKLSQELNQVKNDYQLFNNRALVIKRINSIIVHHASVCENMITLELAKISKSYFKFCDDFIWSLMHGKEIQRISKDGSEFKFLTLTPKGIIYLDRDRKITAVQYPIQDLKHILLFGIKSSPYFQLIFTNKTLTIRSIDAQKTMEMYSGFKMLIKRLKVEKTYDLWSKVQPPAVKQQRRSSATLITPPILSAEVTDTNEGWDKTPTIKQKRSSGTLIAPSMSPATMTIIATREPPSSPQNGSPSKQTVRISSGVSTPDSKHSSPSKQKIHPSPISRQGTSLTSSPSKRSIKLQKNTKIIT